MSAQRLAFWRDHALAHHRLLLIAQLRVGEGERRLNRLIYLSSRMEKLVNDLLYFSRIGRQALAVRYADLNDIVEDVIASLDSIVEEQDVSIGIIGRLPSINCDEARVTELFRNLIVNGIKYNKKTKKTIEIGCKETNYENIDHQYTFFVRDNGNGIPSEFHEEIFRIFKRLEHPGEGDNGTGVGLSYVKKIVTRHGGRIWLESSLGIGTTFYFTLSASE